MQRGRAGDDAPSARRKASPAAPSGRHQVGGFEVVSLAADAAAPAPAPAAAAAASFRATLLYGAGRLRRSAEMLLPAPPPAGRQHGGRRRPVRAT